MINSFTQTDIENAAKKGGFVLSLSKREMFPLENIESIKAKPNDEGDLSYIEFWYHPLEGKMSKGINQWSYESLEDFKADWAHICDCLAVRPQNGGGYPGVVPSDLKGQHIRNFKKGDILVRVAPSKKGDVSGRCDPQKLVAIDEKTGLIFFEDKTNDYWEVNKPLPIEIWGEGWELYPTDISTKKEVVKIEKVPS